MQIAILGRQPKISLAELESLYGAQKITPIADYAASIDIDEPLPQLRLGGTMKSAKLLTRLEKTDLAGGFAYLQKTVPEHLDYLPEGKLQLGVSVYGLPAQKDWLLRQMLTLKKTIKKTGRGVRIIENKTEALEAAVVLYNKLTGPLGWEFLLIRDGNDVLLAQTTGVQNIDDYSKRDFGRPFRDAKNGMLPPKLAQIMINLALDRTKPNSDNHNLAILDPFCGTGTVLMEAYLMDYDIFGSDINEIMVDHTYKNINWLIGEFGDHNGAVLGFRQADATEKKWVEANNVDAVVCEIYLGKPLSALPPKPELDKIVREADQIAGGFLKNIAPQLKSGTRLCLALPAWHLGQNRFLHLPTLENLGNLGYTRLDFKHAGQEDLIYHREDQIVARELTVLEKN